MYHRASIDAVLDAALICHLAFTDGGQPFAVPTLYARVGDLVYVHGSAASRALHILRDGAQVCLTVTLVDGLVLARSVFEHSINYRSVMILGSMRGVDDRDDKLAALKAFTEKLVPGRWAEARQPNGQELVATSILALPITEASAKIRSGPPEDADSADGALMVWAGVLPLHTGWASPIPDPKLRPGIPLPASVQHLIANENASRA